MSMIEKDISKQLEQHRDIIALMNEAFPNSELLPMSYIELMVQNGNAFFTAFYDNHDNNGSDNNNESVFVGLAFVVTTDKMAFLFYLAVNNKIRSKGYGSAILEMIKRKYESKIIILDVEWLDENAQNIEQRIKRVEFYKRSGFDNTNVRLEWRGEVFDILATSNDFSQADFTELLNVFTGYFYVPKMIILA